MKKCVVFLSLMVSLSAMAESNEVSFNPRDDYVFGVGSMAGGALGVIGIIADFNWYSLVNGGIGLGSGIHYDSYLASAKYLILDRSFTPYVGGGFAFWKSTDTGSNIAQNSEVAVDLGLVKSDGTELKSGILILPLSFGIHYMSEVGLAIFAEANYLMSLSNLSGAPYGGLGLQWYF